jgi:hypothetical protein
MCGEFDDDPVVEDDSFEFWWRHGRFPRVGCGLLGCRVGRLGEREHAAGARAQLANLVSDGDAHRRAEAFGLGVRGELVALDRDPDRGSAELHGERRLVVSRARRTAIVASRTPMHKLATPSKIPLPVRTVSATPSKANVNLL